MWPSSLQHVGREAKALHRGGRPSRKPFQANLMVLRNNANGDVPTAILTNTDVPAPQSCHHFKLTHPAA